MPAPCPSVPPFLRFKKINVNIKNKSGYGDIYVRQNIPVRM